MNGSASTQSLKNVTLDIFSSRESNVRSYCRTFPVVFERAQGSEMYTTEGRRFVDLVCGCGSLNFGHNHPAINASLVDYISRAGIVHSLDLHTGAKAKFLSQLTDTVLHDLPARYKVQFTGPTGTNAVEAALKLARKITGRRGVVAFTNGFHGMTLGSLAATGEKSKRNAAGVPLPDILRWPFDNYCEGDLLGLLDTLIGDPSSGVEPPAAFLLESVQAEGGLNVASIEWLQRVQSLAAKHDALTIIDEIQTGCGRTGPFLSFERAKLAPDLVPLAKSIGGGLPLSIVLIREDRDVWEPSEHNGTFCGSNISFVAGYEALRLWQDVSFQHHADELARKLTNLLEDLACQNPELIDGRRGLGMMQGLRFFDPALTKAVQDRAFHHGVLVETCGPRDEVLKIMPALNMSQALLSEAIEIIECAIAESAGKKAEEQFAQSIGVRKAIHIPGN